MSWLYLGWQYAALHPDPGPPPRRPVPPEREQLSREWLAAQRREENLISRPLKLACAAAAAIIVVLVILIAVGWLPVLIAVPAIAVCTAGGGLSGYAIWQGEREVRARIAAERRRVEVFRADQESQLFAWQEEHARQVREWQARRLAFDSQKRWYAVPLPSGIDRVDVAGGTLAGWSALLTMAGAYRLAAGGEVTVIDLSGGAVAADLVTVCRGQGMDPLVWLLPKDLPRLDLSVSLGPEALADVLALAVSAGGKRGQGNDLAVDNAILERVMSVLGADISMARVAAGLRALAQAGDPRDDVTAGLLTERETGQLSTLFGQGATDRVVLERALGMESLIRKLATVASALVPLPRSGLRVVAMEKRVGAVSGRILGSFVITALTHLLAEAPPGSPWRHTIFLMGAERLHDDVLDRLTDACENARTGLVLGYRSIPARVRQRIGRGNAAVVFMRLGNAEDAKAASEQIGTEHRFVLSQLTETVGTSATETTGGSYTSTVGGSKSVTASASVSDSASRGSGHGSSASAGSGFLPFAPSSVSRGAQAGISHGTSESESITAGISASTAWGASTSLATADSQSLAQSLQRSREFLVEQHELQRLPPTAMIVSYAAAAGRQVFVADANPAIGSLGAATMTPLAEAALARGGAPAPAPAADPAPAAASTGTAAASTGTTTASTGTTAASTGGPSWPGIAQPNLGPPSARLDWRKR
jgi:hypothetical protein